MGFNVAADAYGQFMGRYSEPLAERFVGGLTLTPGMRALDVGAGTGAATALLAKALGPGSVVAVEPSGTLSSALRERLPRVEVRADAAESLPFRDAAFDLTIA